MPVIQAVREFESLGATRFIYTDVSRDGTLSGPNIPGILEVATATDCPVVASGGISSLDDLRAVARLHADGVAGAIVGRAFYEHKFTVGEAKYAADSIVAGRDEMELEGEREGR